MIILRTIMVVAMLITLKVRVCWIHGSGFQTGGGGIAFRTSTG